MKLALSLKIMQQHIDCSVVNQFVGHGVGVGFHEPPEIPHHYNNTQIPLAEGMTFTIEPMINAGVREGSDRSGRSMDSTDSRWKSQALNGSTRSSSPKQVTKF